MLDYKVAGMSGKVNAQIIKRDSYLGVRSFAEAMNAAVSWDAQSRSAIIQGNIQGTEVKIIVPAVGNQVTLNGITLQMRTSVQVVDGSMYVQTHSLVDMLNTIMKQSTVATISNNVLEIK